jgi:hypothetical protein
MAGWQARELFSRIGKPCHASESFSLDSFIRCRKQAGAASVFNQALHINVEGVSLNLLAHGCLIIPFVKSCAPIIAPAVVLSACHITKPAVFCAGRVRRGGGGHERRQGG